MTAIGLIITVFTAMWLGVRSPSFLAWLRDLENSDVLCLFGCIIGIGLMVTGISFKLWGVMP